MADAAREAAEQKACFEQKGPFRVSLIFFQALGSLGSLGSGMPQH